MIVDLKKIIKFTKWHKRNLFIELSSTTCGQRRVYHLSRKVYEPKWISYSSVTKHPTKGEVKCSGARIFLEFSRAIVGKCVIWQNTFSNVFTTSQKRLIVKRRRANVRNNSFVIFLTWPLSIRLLPNVRDFKMIRAKNITSRLTLRQLHFLRLCPYVLPRNLSLLRTFGALSFQQHLRRRRRQFPLPCVEKDLGLT